VSVLNRPQKDWDDFLARAQRSRSGSPIRKILWVVVPIGILVVSYLLGRFFAG
jgi:hypothetical protein